MVDNKRFKEVAVGGESANTPLTAGVPGTAVSVVISPSGVLFVTLTDAAGTVSIDVETDNAPAPATPAGVFIDGIHRTTLPTYTDGDAVLLHFDSRGRLLVSPGETGLTADIDRDQDPAPALPVGQFIIGKFSATLPTYTDGDNSVMHFDSRGRLLVSPGEAGLTADVDRDQDPAPATPVGQYIIGKVNVTLPTYLDGDNAVLNFDIRGRNIIRNAPAATGTPSNVAGSATSVTLLAANANRIGATIFNDSTADLFVKFGATASTTSFTVKMTQDAFFEVPANYTGIIDGIWASATGAARVTEIT